MVETDKLQESFQLLLQGVSRGQLNAGIASQREAIGLGAGFLHQWLGDLDDGEVVPAVDECLSRLLQFPLVGPCDASPLRQGGHGLGPGSTAHRQALRTIGRTGDLIAACFLHNELDQGGSVAEEDHGSVPTGLRSFQLTRPESIACCSGDGELP